MFTIKHISYYDTDGIFDLSELKRQDDEEYCRSHVSFEDAFSKIEDYILDRCDFILGYLNNNAIGYLIGEASRGNYWSRKIFVLPEFRNNGYATLLKKEQIELAKIYDCKKLISTFESSNKASKNVQKKVGAIMKVQEGGGINSYIDLS